MEPTLRVALPPLRLARDVSLYEVGLSRARGSIGRVKAFLARQGIKVHVRKDEISGTRVESVLRPRHPSRTGELCYHGRLRPPAICRRAVRGRDPCHAFSKSGSDADGSLSVLASR